MSLLRSWWKIFDSSVYRYFVPTELVEWQRSRQVETSPSAKPEWLLTREAFAKLLACLDADAERAGEKYETVRRTLVKFFNWRGAAFAEELADETLNRVVRKLDEGDEIRDIPTYCHGVARRVFLETLKGPDSKRASLDEARAVTVTSQWVEDEDQQYECFESCLEGLPSEGRQVILQYYQHERRAKIDDRKSLAKTLGIPLSALRSRAQRLRDKLEQCVEECIARSVSPT